MKRHLLGVLAAGALVLAVGSPARALPTLQLDILGGTYDPVTQTVVTTSNNFTLYAYLALNGTNGDNTASGKDEATLLADEYYLSIALLPKGATAGTYGTLNVTPDGEATQGIDVTGDMTYGTPPVEADPLHQGQDLAPHDIYNTYFYELAFGFLGDDGHKADPYNTQDTPGVGPSGSLTDPSDYMYYRAFQIDATGTPGALYHFDLYSTEDVLVQHGNHPPTLDRQIDIFAPFSHDAEMTAVPEPGTMTLLGAGLAGLGVLRRRRARRDRDDA